MGIMKAPSKQSSLVMISIGVLVVFAIVLAGAVPYLLMPTLGQAHWALGFADSMANTFPPSPYATNFGNPEPAAISFGLSAVYPMSLLLQLGIQPASAYSAIFALYLGAAALGSYWLFRNLSGSHWPAIIFAFVWMASPMISVHQGYSMLALGIALLPTYLFIFRNFLVAVKDRSDVLRNFVALAFISILSVFMDGYTYVMFASAAGLWTLAVAFQSKRLRDFGIHMLGLSLSFGFSYLLYALYIGRSSFSAHSTDFFRGWGVDVTFFLAPTRGQHWLPDLLRLSVGRSQPTQFGDASVWTSTYLLPLIVLFVLAILVSRKNSNLRKLTPFVLITIFAIWMSLGPSLKFDSKRPENVQTQLMEEKYAILPTGNELVSTLPGFNNMRASYRWAALGTVGILMVVSSTVPNLNQKNRRRLSLVGVITLMAFVPNPVENINSKRAHYLQNLSVEAELVEQLKADVKGERGVLFLPTGNDFFSNYLSSRANFYTYNIGGDKNLGIARSHWPIDFLQISQLGGEIDFDPLSEAGVNFVVVPNFDLLWSAHAWPCGTISGSPDCFASYSEIRLEQFSFDSRYLVESNKVYQIYKVP